jgi:3-oxoacyl-[acyl-carrier protein] reductase
MKLAGKTALVTGAGRGIGRAIALRLAQEGATVAINYAASAEAAESLATSINEAGGKAFAIRCDVGSIDDIKAMFEILATRIARLDILVNNAGRGSGGLPTLETLTPEEFDHTFNLNTRGLFFVTQAAVALMPEGGRIVNLSSSSSQTRQPGLSAYAGSKAAVEAFTRIWSTEVAKRKITVNAILPGIVDTDLIRENLPPELAKRYGNAVPLGRLGQPQDIADVVAFLCSDDARWITGECIKVSGGA